MGQLDFSVDRTGTAFPAEITGKCANCMKWYEVGDEVLRLRPEVYVHAYGCEAKPGSKSQPYLATKPGMCGTCHLRYSAGDVIRTNSKGVIVHPAGCLVKSK